MAEDYYSILEVGRNATPEEIKRSYRRLVMKYHPDHNQGDKAAEEKFKQIGTAYEVLSDPQKKNIYDQVGHERYTQAGGAAGGGFGGQTVDFGDLGDLFGGMFGDMFGGGGGQRKRNADAPRKGHDLHYRLTISFEDAVYGTEKEITLNYEDTCSHCKGSGGEPGAKKVTCPQCHGTGNVSVRRGFFQMQSTCTACQGRGFTYDKTCGTCHGRGIEQVRNRKVKFNIPAGVDTGNRMTLSGQGGVGIMGGPQGDFVVEFIVEEHSIFKRNGLELYCEVPVPFATAALGGEIDIPSIDGTCTLKIPAGTQNGAVLSVSGKGVKALRGTRRGNLNVKVLIEVPVNLSSDQKKILQEFAKSCEEKNNSIWKAFKEKAKKFFSK